MFENRNSISLSTLKFAYLIDLNEDVKEFKILSNSIPLNTQNTFTYLVLLIRNILHNQLSLCINCKFFHSGFLTQ